MGSKAAIISFGEGERVFSEMPAIDLVRSHQLARSILNTGMTEVGPVMLDSAVWPADGVVCVAATSGHEVVCSREFAIYRPSELTAWVLGQAAGRDAYGVFMHSAEDWAAFAVWSDGNLVRSVSLNPEYGVMEDRGDRLSFELPYWNGERSMEGYALQFYPPDLGNEALKKFFGFVLEGYEDEYCIDSEEVDMAAFSGSLKGMPARQRGR